MKYLAKCFKKHIFTGILVLLPVMGTLWFLSIIYNFFDNINIEFLEAKLGIKIPGIQILLVFLLLFFTGLLFNTSLGRTVLKYSEKAIARLPFIKGVYGGIKQLTNTFSTRGEKDEAKVVLAEYPRKGIWQVGFVTSDAWEEIRKKAGKTLINVLMPTTPNPTGGMLILVPSGDLIPLEMSYNEGMKYIVSGGVVNPYSRIGGSDGLESPLERSNIKNTCKD